MLFLVLVHMKVLMKENLRVGKTFGDTVTTFTNIIEHGCISGGMIPLLNICPPCIIVLSVVDRKSVV